MSEAATFGRGAIEIRLGDYRETLADVEAQALIFDAPYSDRTHSGSDSGRRTDTTAEGNKRRDRRTGNTYASGNVRVNAIEYEPWGRPQIVECVEFFKERISGWRVTLTDHVLGAVWAEEFERSGLYPFAPLPGVGDDEIIGEAERLAIDLKRPIPVVQPGRSVRLAGDGPSSWSTWVMVARPRALRDWGTLDGAYVQPRGLAERPVIVGGKPLWLMRALIRDYTRPGDLVVDCCAGGGTTLLAAALEGRRGIGAECDPDTYAIACKRFAATAITPPLFTETKAAEQVDLFGRE